MYRWVDDQGVVHYSDTPHPGAEQLSISGAQTYHGTPAPPAPASAPDKTADAPYQSCAITQPAADSDIFAPEAVNIAVQLVPTLRPGDQLGVAVDGQTLAPLAGGTYQVVQPERGTHTISAEVRGADGAVLCTAAPVSFSVQRPSVFAPQTPVKPH